MLLLRGATRPFIRSKGCRIPFLTQSLSTFNPTAIPYEQLDVMLGRPLENSTNTDGGPGSTPLLFSSVNDVNNLLITMEDGVVDTHQILRGLIESCLSPSSTNKTTSDIVSTENSSKFLQLFRQKASHQDIRMLRSALLMMSPSPAATRAPPFKFNFSMDDINAVIKRCIARSSTKEAVDWLYLAQDQLKLSPNQQTFDLLIPAVAKEKHWDQLLYLLAEARLSGRSRVAYSKRVLNSIIREAARDPLTRWEPVHRVVSAACEAHRKNRKQSIERSTAGATVSDSFGAFALSPTAFKSALDVLITAQKPDLVGDMYSIDSLSSPSLSCLPWEKPSVIESSGCAAIAVGNSELLLQLLKRNVQRKLDSSSIAGSSSSRSNSSGSSGSSACGIESAQLGLQELGDSLLAHVTSYSRQAVLLSKKSSGGSNGSSTSNSSSSGSSSSEEAAAAAASGREQQQPQHMSEAKRLALLCTAEHKKNAHEIGLLIAWHFIHSSSDAIAMENTSNNNQDNRGGNSTSGTVNNNLDNRSGNSTSGTVGGQGAATAVSLWNKYCKSLAALADSTRLSSSSSSSSSGSGSGSGGGSGALEKAIQDSASRCVESLLSTICRCIIVTRQNPNSSSNMSSSNYGIELASKFLSAVLFSESNTQMFGVPTNDGALKAGTAATNSSSSSSGALSSPVSNIVPGSSSSLATARRALLFPSLHMRSSLAEGLITVFSQSRDSFATAATMLQCLRDGAVVSDQAMHDVMEHLQRDNDHQLVVQLLELHMNNNEHQETITPNKKRSTRRGGSSSDGEMPQYSAALYTRAVESLVQLGQLDDALDLLLKYLPGLDLLPNRNSVLVLMHALKEKERYDDALRLFQTARYPLGEDAASVAGTTAATASSRAFEDEHSLVEEGDIETDDIALAAAAGAASDYDSDSICVDMGIGAPTSRFAVDTSQKVILDDALFMCALQCCALSLQPSISVALFEERDSLLRTGGSKSSSSSSSSKSSTARLGRDVETVLLSLSTPEFAPAIVPFLQSMSHFSTPIDGSNTRLLKVALCCVLSAGAEENTVVQLIEHCRSVGFALDKISAAELLATAQSTLTLSKNESSAAELSSRIAQCEPLQRVLKTPLKALKA